MLPGEWALIERIVEDNSNSSASEQFEAIVTRERNSLLDFWEHAPTKSSSPELHAETLRVRKLIRTRAEGWDAKEELIRLVRDALKQLVFTVDGSPDRIGAIRAIPGNTAKERVADIVRDVFPSQFRTLRQTTLQQIAQDTRM